MGKLKGHWHLYEYNESDHININEYHTIDFEENNNAIFDKHGFYSPLFLSAKVDLKTKTISRRGECFVLNYKYEWANDSLFLTDTEEYDEKHFAEKCGTICCDKQKDFFSKTGLLIDLPIIEDTLAAINKGSFITSLEVRILIGVSKEEPNKKPKLKLDSEFASPDDLIIRSELMKQTVVPKLRNHVFYTLFANKKIDFKEIFEIIEVLKSLNTEHIYLALREEDTTKELKIWRKKINLDNPNLLSILEEHYEKSNVPN